MGGRTEWTRWIEKHIDTKTGKELGPSSEWQTSVKKATEELHVKFGVKPMCILCGVKPTFNGKPGEKCTRSCQGKVGGATAICIAPGCNRPTFNGKPGEYCGRSCKKANESLSDSFSRL